MKSSLVFTTIFMSITFPLIGQVNETFEDGELNNNPNWSGESSKFTVENGELRLFDSTETGLSYLSLSSDVIEGASWSIDFSLSFNPSSSNYFDFVLASSQLDLVSSDFKIFVRIGGSNDNSILYYQEGTNVEPLIIGANDRWDNSSVQGSIRVERNEGIWSLYVDSGTGYELEGLSNRSMDFIPTAGGIVCIYTATRSTKMWFDNVVITGDPYTDLSPPELVEVKVVDSTTISLRYSEAIINENLIQNYQLLPGNIYPENVLTDADSVMFEFASPLQSGQPYDLFISGILDASANLMPDTLVPIIYVYKRQNQAGDITISEVFPDPEPSVGLPLFEYVEIVNRSETPIDISGWRLCDESRCGNLNDGFLLVNEYAVLIPKEAVLEFPTLKTFVVDPWPTLNNSGESITLIDDLQITIDSIRYENSWFEPAKNSGGYSLEMKSFENHCQGSAN